MHPLDAKGKTPLNLEHGILSTASSLAGQHMIALSPGEKWETLKSAPKEAFNNALTSTAPPVRVSRTVLESSGGARIISTRKDSSIAYDPKEHRFVNSTTASPGSSEKVARGDSERVPGPSTERRDGNAAVAVAPPARNITPPRNSVPPPVPRYSGGGERSSVGGGSGGAWGGAHSSGGGSTHSAPAPAPAPHASSGGRPH
jgi:hypothetical protein